MTRLPLDLPALLEMAERRARDRHAAYALAAQAAGAGPVLAWVLLGMTTKDLDTLAEARLLSDLTRPESQAVWLRWLAERVGVPVPVGSPCWYLVPERPTRESRAVDGEYLDHEDGAPTMWVLSSDGDERTFAWWDPDDGPAPAPGDGVDVWLPSWSDAPIGALVLAILTVGGAR